jgi:thiamine biosynthesis protein ThiS
MRDDLKTPFGEVCLNGQTIPLPYAGMTLDDLFTHLAISPTEKIVVYQGEVIRSFDGVLLQDQDDIELLHFVGGGAVPKAAICTIFAPRWLYRLR